MPRVARRLILFTSTVDVRHGVRAALDVGAAQERATVEADLLDPAEYETCFSVEEDK